jgi:hypothetical protein
MQFLRASLPALVVSRTMNYIQEGSGLLQATKGGEETEADQYVRCYGTRRNTGGAQRSGGGKVDRRLFYLERSMRTAVER